MADNSSRILIETIVRQALRHFQEDPERTCRKLVDMAFTVSTSRFQKSFFQGLQRMQKNEQSAYYPLARRIVQDVEHERLIRFGMNVGYNSCTAGAKKIRETEAAEGFNIPWSMFLDIDAGSFPDHVSHYDSLLRQGEELGICTWFVGLDAWSHDVCEWLEAHPNCAFVLFMKPDVLDEGALDEAGHLEHVMFSISTGDGTRRLCAAMHDRKMLYAVHQTYHEEDVKDILNDNFFYDAQELHAIFTVLLPHASCSENTQDIVYDYVKRTRSEQKFATIAWDMVQDVLTVDTVISEDSCSAGFRADGSFFQMTDYHAPVRFNGFTTPLKEILRQELKKA